MFRHGTASLLLNKHPEHALVIANRIGDEVSSLMKFYGWIDAVKMMELGQDLMIGLYDD
ncbi:hypothetical protein [Rhodobacter sp. NSM]|uniref:hypothetical protein n=1 Tax=Rhodobacter sp. NSM TaxID=3457501 RepID=UPI003FD2982B